MGLDVGGIFGSVLGGVLKGQDPADVLKEVATHATASAAAPVIDQYLMSHLSAAGRVEVADNLIKAGEAIKAGNIQDGSNAIAALIGNIKF
jgi:hypothetical protein